MAVIQRTECRGLSIRLTQGFFLVLVLGLVRCTPKGCEQARKDVEAANLTRVAVLVAPIQGELCGDYSCCSKSSEQDLFVENKRQLNSFIKDSIFKVSSLIEVRAKKFDVLFREMMNTSKLEFHEMFEKTYGKIYLQNSDVFSDFFMELENYYKKGSTKLADTLENFFIILYRRMFTVINAQYTFDDSYLECVADRMKDVKPFGDLPQKFALQLKRSFIVTRTYYKALSMLAEVARKLITVGIDKDCDKEMVQMRYCGACKGLRGVGTCATYCSSVLTKCLRNFVEFGTEWDKFVDSLDKIAERLVGPYNIEIVVEPLNIKISEAIMNFQESGTDVTKKIFSLCGQPTLARRRRSAERVDDNPKYEIKPYQPLKKVGGHKKKKNKKFEEEDTGPTLEKVVREIRTKIRDTRNFWSNLPYQFCNEISAAPSAADSCWNGTAVSEFAASAAPPPGDSAVVKDQIYRLQQFSDQLRNAYHGDEVQFIDDSDESFDGSGSGSGDFPFEEEEEEDNRVAPKISDDFEPIDEVPQVSSSTSRPQGKKTSGAATMSLNKALAQFLLPIVLVWFGGAISDLL